MPKSILVIALSLLVTACQNAPVSFNSMTELELLAYNEERPLAEKVFCSTEAETSSRIRKRHCRTYEQIVNHNEKAVMQLEVLNTNTGGFNFPQSEIRNIPH